MTSTTDYRELTGTYTLDPAHSRIGFVTRHAMVTKVRGAFNEFTGNLRLDGDNPQQSSAEVSVQAASIDTRNTDRDAHLRSNDFLQMEDYPEITFHATDIAHVDQDTFEVTGDLTIKGTTHPVTIPFTFEGQVVDAFGDTRVGFEGSTTINRKDFGVSWNAVMETGGVMVSEKVVLEFEISAVKQS